MDQTDIAILAIIQRDAGSSVSEIAKRVNLSLTPCWRRIQRLEQSQVLVRRVGLLSAPGLNLFHIAFVEAEPFDDGPAWIARFRGVIDKTPEIVEVNRLPTRNRYLLRLVVPSVTECEKICLTLRSSVRFKEFTVEMSAETLKYTTELPLTYVFI